MTFKMVCNNKSRVIVLQNTFYRPISFVVLPMIKVELGVHPDNNWMLFVGNSHKLTGFRMGHRFQTKTNKCALVFRNGTNAYFMCCFTGGTKRVATDLQPVLRSILFNGGGFECFFDLLPPLHSIYFLSGSLSHIARIGLTGIELAVLYELSLRARTCEFIGKNYQEEYLRRRTWILAVRAEEVLRRAEVWEEYTSKARMACLPRVRSIRDLTVTRTPSRSGTVKPIVEQPIIEVSYSRITQHTSRTPGTKKPWGSAFDFTLVSVSRLSACYRGVGD
jgi:hypothetical protein